MSLSDGSVRAHSDRGSCELFAIPIAEVVTEDVATGDVLAAEVFTAEVSTADALLSASTARLAPCRLPVTTVTVSFDRWDMGCRFRFPKRSEVLRFLC